MKDGTDAVSDWPLLNALLNTAGGATWVSLHHGGGVGMGYSQHAGVVIVCDGTRRGREAHRARAVERPGTGVMRHADAGYEIAIACAREQGLNLPMLGALMATMTRSPARSALDAAAGDPRRRRASSRSTAAGARRRSRASAAVVQRAAAAATPRSTASTPASASSPRRASSDADLAHAAAQPDPLAQRSASASRCAAPVVRLMLALKAASLARGHSGVREAVVDTLLARRTTPASCPSCPAQGSVGASGDLAPLAHLTLALIGEGEMLRRRRARAGCARRCAPPASRRSCSSAKEGLALINGTQVSTALALHALFAFEPVLEAALVVGALTVDAARGSDGPFDPRIHALRGQPGQIDVARYYRALLAGSEIRRSHLRGRRPRAGPVLPALPAAGRRRLPRPAAPRRAGAAARGQRGHRQPAGLRRRRTATARSSRAATSTPSRWPSPPTPWRSRSPRSARSPSGASRC